MNARDTANALRLPLGRLVLCLDCETCFEIHRSVSGLWQQRYVGIGGALSLRETGHMKDISDPARLPSSDESIAPVTILDAQGHVVRVVGARPGVLRRSVDNIAVLLEGADDEYQYMLSEALDAKRFSDDNGWVVS